MSSQGSQSSSTRKPSRGVGGRLGRGRSTGGRRGSGGATKGNRPNSSAKRSTSREARTQSNNAIAPIKSASTNSSDTANCMPSMRDEVSGFCFVGCVRLVVLTHLIIIHS